MADKLILPLDHRVVHIVSQHRRVCCECGGHIEQLDVYQHVTGSWPNSRRNQLFRTCGHCDEIRDWLLNETDWPGISNVPGTFIFRRLRQHLIQQSRNGDRAFRIPALRRVVEMNRRRAAAKSAPWLKWLSGVCPVEHGQLVDVKFRDGSHGWATPAGALDWAHYDEGTDIISYRRCDPAKASS